MRILEGIRELSYMTKTNEPQARGRQQCAAMAALKSNRSQPDYRATAYIKAPYWS